MRKSVAIAALIGGVALPLAAQADIPMEGSRIHPESITSDAAGNIYTGSTGGTIYRVVPGGDKAVPIERLHVDSKDAEEIVAGKWDNPILQPWARDIVKRNAESEIALNHVYQADDSCWPSGVQMLNVREPVVFLQEKDKVTILYQRDHHVRHIYLNQKHSANPEPSWFGESVGRYEDGALVVDTIAIKTHKMSVVDNYGTPHTDKLHVIERYRPINDKDGKRIEVTLRIEDPGAFTTPWRAVAFYRTSREQRFAEVVCADMDQLFDVVNDRLKQIPGVRATESFVYFDIHTHRFDWDVPE